MQQDFAELTVTAVEDIYGPLTACIYSTLAYHGRKTQSQLVKLTRLPLRQIQSSLTVLVQHHIAQYTTNELDQTQYIANSQTAYNVAFRYSKLSQIIREREGEKAVIVFRKFATLGQATLDDIIKNLESEVSEIETKQIVNRLLLSDFLRLVTAFDFQSIEDFQASIEKEQFKLYAGPPKTKDKREAKSWKITNKKRYLNAGYLNLPNAPSKRPKLESGINRAQVGIVSNRALRINYDKCSVLLRNSQLVSLAHRHVGDATAKVLEALLRSLEQSTRRCYDPFTHDDYKDDEYSSDEQYAKYSSSLEDIIQYIDSNFDLGQGLPNSTKTNGVNGHSKINGHGGHGGHGEHVQTEKRKITDESRIVKLQAHLKILQSTTPQFVMTLNSLWYVNFETITSFLVQNEIENTITARLGSISSRIIRILHARYATDEKDLTKRAILKQKEVRAAANAMLAAGLIETREIARDANRTTNKLTWLYSYDPSKARAQLITDSYRSMIRLMKRLQFERDTKQVAPLLEKRKVAKTDSFELDDLETRILEEFDNKERILMGYIERIDDLVACLRDFAPLNDPYIGNRKKPHESFVESDDDDDDEDDILPANR